jgi:acyl-ACP thioesterase
MKRTPSSSVVDTAKSLRVSTAFDYFQDIAGLHADNLGAGIDHIKEAFGVAWILMRIRLEVNRMPHLEEPVIVETWPQPPKVRYDRDYLIKTEKDGEVLAKAVSSWILMDLAAHDIAKGKLFEYTYDIRESERAIGHKLLQLKAPGPPAPVIEHPVRYSDIDYNLHVNNARYIDFIMDSYPLQFHQEYEAGMVEVNYINEVRPEETLIISRAAYPDADTGPADYIELTSADDGRTAIKAAIEFRKRKQGSADKAE